MRRLSGFSLMEMMTVLLIVSIVAAASAPMINKRMMIENANLGGCAWEEVNNGIAYNLDGNANASVIIGSDNIFDNIHSRLHIASDDADSPQITLSDNSRNPATNARLFYRNGGFGWTTSNNELGEGSVAIGLTNVSANNSVAIGLTNVSANNSVAIGNANIGTNSTSSIAINGDIGAVAISSIAIKGTVGKSAFNSIAIGRKATIKDECNNGIVIGYNATLAKKGSNNSIAIGTNAVSEGGDCIAIGREASSLDVSDGGSSITIGSPAYIDDIRTPSTNRKAEASGASSIAIGDGPLANKKRAMAIGFGTDATGEYSTALGALTIASANHATAIGTGALADKDNQIVLGTKDDIVYIPGRLVVDGHTYLARNVGSHVYMREASGNEQVWKFNKGVECNDNHTECRAGMQKVVDTGKTITLSGYTFSSDRRLKNVGKAFTGGLAELKKLDLFHYTYKKDKSKTPRVGVMAQDLQKVFPDAVTKGEDGFLRIRMEDMFYALVNAVKELANMFDRQDDRIVQLEKENKQLQKTVSDLEKRLAKLEKQK